MRGVNVYQAAQEQRRLWTPGQMDLRCWWDFSDITTLTYVGSKISQIADKSGKGNHATQTTDGNRPAVSTLNGLVAGSFTAASSQNMNFASGVEPNFIAAVVTFSTVGANRSLVGADSTGSGAYDAYYFGSTSANVFRFLRCTTVATPNTDMVSTGGSTGTANRPYLMSGRHNNSVIQGWLNGVSAATDTASTGLRDVLAGSLGCGYYNSAKADFWNGLIAEVLIGPFVETDIRLKVEGYLAWKWGTTSFLVANHQYRNQPPLI